MKQHVVSTGAGNTEYPTREAALAAARRVSKQEIRASYVCYDMEKGTDCVVEDVSFRLGKREK